MAPASIRALTHSPLTTHHSLLAGLFLFLMISCHSGKHTEDPERWSEAQAVEWFDQKEWLGQTELQPHPSIDKKEFAARYHQNKERWDKAFAFLLNEDLSAIEAGNHEIDGKNVYAIVSEYISKNHEDAQYESHKNYTDLQYVVSGAEYIGLTDLSSASAKTPYDEERDIAFYNVENGQKLLAKPGTFFIFFPDNAHSPGMKVDQNFPVKKVVVKVRN
jgi:biofilm protein TabA